MKEIPSQLHNEELRFVLLKPRDKIPFEKDWQHNGYKFNDPKLLQHIKGGNYGLIGGYGNLRVLDIDQKEYAEKLHINTFTIKTGRGGFHFYFFCDYGKNHVLRDGIGELRANNYQVVGANSIHPNGKRYEVINDVPITTLSTEQLLEIIRSYLRPEISETLIKTEQEPKIKDDSRSGVEYRYVIGLIKRGKSKTEVFEEMSANFKKWNEAPPQYRELTYNKALVFLEKDKLKPNQKKEVKYEPKTLEEVKTTIKKWLHIQDIEVVDVLLAVAISNKVRGDPIWLFLIAASGAAKTELLRTFAESSLFYHLSNLTPNTLISGMVIDKKKVEDLLPQLDGKTLVFKDFTVILEKNRDQRNEIISQLRDAYDGTYSKKFGTIDKKVGYDSKFSLIAGVTPIIDKHWKVMQQLGERFLKYRLKEDMDATTKRAYKNEGLEAEMRMDLKEAIMGFIMNLEVPSDIKFDDTLYMDYLILLAKFIAIARTPVQTVSSSEDFYFDFEPVPEQPTRLAKQLKKMAKCLAIVRGKDGATKYEMHLLNKIADFTVPQERIKILDFIYDNEQQAKEVTLSMIEKHMALPYSSTHRLLEQLYRLGLISSESVKITFGDKDTAYLRYSLQGVAKERYTLLTFYNEPIQKCHGGVSRDKPNEINTTQHLFDFVKTHDKGQGVSIQLCEKYANGSIDPILTQAKRESLVFENRSGFLKVLE